jgi:hypothetical protein
MATEKISDHARFTVINTFRGLSIAYSKNVFHKNSRAFWKWFFQKESPFRDIHNSREALVNNPMIRKFDNAIKLIEKSDQHPFFTNSKVTHDKVFTEDYCIDHNLSIFLFLLSLGSSTGVEDYEVATTFYLCQMSKLAEAEGKPSNSIYFAEVVINMVRGKFKLKPNRRKIKP